MSIQSIASIIGARKTDQGGVRTFIRENIKANPKAIESLAGEVARMSTSVSDRDKRLSILRMRLREVCDELRIPKRTVKLRGDSYRLEVSKTTTRSSTGTSHEDLIYRPLREAVAKASSSEKEVMQAIVLGIFGISRRP